MTNPITDQNIREMRNNMDESDIEGFDNFIERNWGAKKRAVAERSRVTATEERRGRPRKSEI